MFVLHLEPGENRELECVITASGRAQSGIRAVAVNRAINFGAALEERQSELAAFRSGWAVISASNNEFAIDDSRRGASI